MKSGPGAYKLGGNTKHFKKIVDRVSQVANVVGSEGFGFEAVDGGRVRGSAELGSGVREEKAQNHFASHVFKGFERGRV